MILCKLSFVYNDKLLNMACGLEHFSSTNLDTHTVLTELRKIFDNCDINGSQEVEIDPLVNQMCTVMPAIENQEALKITLFQLLSSSTGPTVVKRDKFEECMQEWINIVFGRNDCSILEQRNSSPAYKSGIKLGNTFTTSTPIRRIVFQHENYIENIGDEMQFENEKYTSQNDSNNTQMEYKEELLTLKQRNAKLETTIADLKSHLSIQENSPCGNCKEMQFKIDGLKRTHKQITEANIRHCEELAEELSKYKEENEKFKHTIALGKKSEDNLQITIDQLQTQMSELLDHLTNEQRKGEDSKNKVIEMERNRVEYMMNFEYVENKLLNASAENESLKKDIRNLEEHIFSQRNNFKVSLESEEEEDCSSLFTAVLAENNLLQELNNEVPRYGFTDAFTQTSVIITSSVGIQISPHVRKKRVQTSVTVTNQQVQATVAVNSQESQVELPVSSQTITDINRGNEMLPDDTRSEDVFYSEYEEANITNQLDELQVIGEEEADQFLQLQNSLKRKKKKKRSGWTILCCCLIAVPLIIASIIYFSRECHPCHDCFGDMLQSLNIPFVYSQPPPM